MEQISPQGWASRESQVTLHLVGQIL